MGSTHAMQRSARGWTLVELMLALVILVTTLVLGTPLMQSFVQGNRLWGASSRFLLALSLARSEAILRNRTVSICPSSFYRTRLARCSGTYADGWIVFTNASRDRVIDDATDTVLRGFEGLPRGYAVANRLGTRAVSTLINFNTDGTANVNRTLRFCPPQSASRASISIVLNMVGRARLYQDVAGCSLG